MDYHGRYDEGYLRTAEKKVEEIRNRALEKVRAVFPTASYVVDPRSMDDYLDKVWDYPGMWYVGFRLPDGFKSEEELTADIAAATMRHLTEKR